MFTEGDPGTSTPATTVTADWLNDTVQEEIIQFVEEEGITPNKSDNDQLGEAINLAARREGRKNLFINGGFDIWQRGTSMTIISSTLGYTADRWVAWAAGCTLAFSRQLFAAGQTDVPDARQSFLKIVNTTGVGTPDPVFEQRVEDLEALAGKKIVFSFYGRVQSGTVEVVPRTYQYFGVGGSSAVEVPGTPVTLTTTWQRFEQEFTLGSMSGKTITSGTYTGIGLNLDDDGPTHTLEFANFQAERALHGAATSFESRPLAEEMDACLRYFWTTYQNFVNPGTVTDVGKKVTEDDGDAQQDLNVDFPTKMRAVPTMKWYSPTTGASNKVRILTTDYTVQSVIGTGENHTGYPNLNPGGPGSGTHICGAHMSADAEL
jgi:hypothetical protein